MIDLLKKTVLAGIGATVTTKEKIESVLGEYVEKGKLSTNEAKSLAERINEDGRQEFESAKHEVSARINEFLKKGNFASREDLAALEKRLALLDAKVDLLTAKVTSHEREGNSHSAKHH